MGIGVWGLLIFFKPMVFQALAQLQLGSVHQLPKVGGADAQFPAYFNPFFFFEKFQPDAGMHGIRQQLDALVEHFREIWVVQKVVVGGGPVAGACILLPASAGFEKTLQKLVVQRQSVETKTLAIMVGNFVLQDCKQPGFGVAITFEINDALSCRQKGVLHQVFGQMVVAGFV